MSVPETVILHMQHHAYELIDDIEAKKKVVKQAEKDNINAQDSLDFTILRLKETVDFLQMYNSDAVKGTWAEEVGLDKYVAKQACYNCSNSNIDDNCCPALDNFRSAIAYVVDHHQSHQSNGSYDLSATKFLNELAPIIAANCGRYNKKLPTQEEIDGR